MGWEDRNPWVDYLRDIPLLRNIGLPRVCVADGCSTVRDTDTCGTTAASTELGVAGRVRALLCSHTPRGAGQPVQVVLSGLFSPNRIHGSPSGEYPVNAVF